MNGVSKLVKSRLWSTLYIIRMDLSYPFFQAANGLYHPKNSANKIKIYALLHKINLLMSKKNDYNLTKGGFLCQKKKTNYIECGIKFKQKSNGYYIAVIYVPTKGDLKKPKTL